MKKTLLIAAAALMTSALFAYDEEILEFNGTPATYTKTEYSVTSKFGEYFRTVDMKHVHTYSDGLMTKTVSLNPKDEVLDSIEYEYGEDKKLASEILKDSAGTTFRKISYDYYPDGKLKSESAYSSAGDLTGKTIYKYEDNRTTESLYNSEGKLVSRTISYLAKDGRTSEAAYYFSDGSLSHAEKFTYDENGKTTMVENLDSDGKKAGRTVYCYDKNGWMSEIQVYATENDLIQREVYTTDGKGNPLKVSIYEIAEKFGATANELISITEYSYSY